MAGSARCCSILALYWLYGRRRRGWSEVEAKPERGTCHANRREIARDKTKQRGKVDDSVPLPTVLRAVIYTVEVLLETCDATQAGGVVLVVDLDSLSMSRAQRLHPEVRLVWSGWGYTVSSSGPLMCSLWRLVDRLRRNHQKRRDL